VTYLPPGPLWNKTRRLAGCASVIPNDATAADRLTGRFEARPTTLIAPVKIIGKKYDS
jgi:hypothetical protein